MQSSSTTIFRKPAAAALSEPGRFGRFRLLERIGAGSVADVWKAEVPRADGTARTYALKRLRAPAGDAGELTAMLEDEARVCELLVHPNIVRVHELGWIEGECYLAMEHVDGHDLATVLGTLDRVRHRLPIPVAGLITRQIALGLAHAHALRDARGGHLGIVHRDVSPGNVMITRKGAVKLLDFGIAKIASHLRRNQTEAGLVKGHVPYMAPEQLLGRPLDARTDVFALGVVLWEMLVMRPLFWDPDPRLAAANLLRGTLTVPSARRREVPPALDAVVMKALARNPDERWASADELADALDRFVGDAGQSQTDLTHIVSAIPTHLPETSHWSQTAPVASAARPAAPSAAAAQAVRGVAPAGPPAQVLDDPTISDNLNERQSRHGGNDRNDETDVGRRPGQRRHGRERGAGGASPGRLMAVALLAGAVGAMMVLLVQRFGGQQVSVSAPAVPLVSAVSPPAMVIQAQASPPSAAPIPAGEPARVVHEAAQPATVPVAVAESAGPVEEPKARAAATRAAVTKDRSSASPPRRGAARPKRHAGLSPRRGAATAAPAIAPVESPGNAKPNPF